MRLRCEGAPDQCQMTVGPYREQTLSASAKVGAYAAHKTIPIPPPKLDIAGQDPDPALIAETPNVELKRDKKSAQPTKRPASVPKATPPPKKQKVAPQTKPLQVPHQGALGRVKSFLWKSLIVLALISGLYVYASGFDIRHFAPSIERFAKDQLATQVTIEGGIHLLNPIVKPGLSLGQVTFYSGEDEAQPVAVFDKMELRFHLGSFFQGNQIPKLLGFKFYGGGITIDPESPSGLQKLTETATNFSAVLPETIGAVGINSVALEDSQLTWGKSGDEESVTFPVQSLEFWAEEDDLALTLSGRFGDEAYAVSGELRDLDAFYKSQHASVDFTGALGSTFVIMSGELTEQSQASDVSLQVLGPDLSGLSRVFGYDKGVKDAPFAFTVNLSGSLWGQLAGEVEGLLDGAPLTGRVLGNLQYRPAINIDLTSSTLDLSLLKPFVSQPGAFLFADPDGEIGGNWAGTIALKADNVTVGEANLGPGEISLSALEDRTSFTIRQGKDDMGFFELSGIRTHAAIERLDLEVTARQFKLGDALSALTDQAGGKAVVNLAADLEGRSDGSVPLFSTLDGDVHLILAADEVIAQNAPLLPDHLEMIFGPDIANGLAMKNACFANKSAFVKGRLIIEAFALDTESAITSGGGYVDFPGDAIRLSVRPRPKDPRQLADAVDVEIGGALSAPQFVQLDRDLSRGLSSSLSVFDTLSATFENADMSPCADSLLGL